MKAKFPPDPILLISDLHLDPARPGLTRAFCDFLATTATEAGALYILGDFFNVWIGDDDDAPLGRDVSQALQRLSATGTAVYLMHGNRDFLLGERFARACGATLVHEPVTLEHGQQRYLLMHGDALCTLDASYMAFRSMVRAPAWQQEFLAKSLGERRTFAAQARAQSKSMSSNKADDIMDVSPDEVARVLTEHDADTLIHGHTHRPAVHTLACGGRSRTRIVLGDWDQLGWYVTLSKGKAELRNFAISP